jgi:uncharacterized RDD family membrane protein YckC
LGSWLLTPGQSPELLAEPQDFRGQRLGLPEYGPGSIAPVGRRVAALVVDWLSSLLVASLLAGTAGGPDRSVTTLAVFAVQVTVLQYLMGASFGQRLLGVAVIRVDGGRLGIVPLLLRTALICLVVPPLVWDNDTRGLHDKAVRTVCVAR